ncbi:MAG: HAMP domain-containing sensor histidine kinase [Siphonobacter sp.]
MRLLEKTNRIYLAFSLSLYIVTAFALYFLVKLLIYDEVEGRLLTEKRDFLAYVKHFPFTKNSYFVENKIEVDPGNLPAHFTETLKDTLIQDRYTKEFIPYRQLTFYSNVNNTMHRISIRKSLIQTHRLIEAITVTMITFLGLLMLGTFWFQGRLSGKLWQPFYDTLARVKLFQLSRGTPLELAPTQEITEFSELNEVLQKMSNQILLDYYHLKEFTENASHELQTPLAIINAKVEQLFQSEGLTKDQSRWIQSIYSASRRMSRLNQGLLLLAKIENRQFQEVKEVNLTEEFVERLTDMDEMLTHKQIQLEISIQAPFVTPLSPVLAESLVTNLISNAIKHNVAGGSITLFSTEDLLCLKNTGEPLQLHNPKELFSRFKKESDSDSAGLGLAIVQQICESYQLSIEYTETEGLHSMFVQRHV